MVAAVHTEETCETVLRVYVRGKGKVWEYRIGFDEPVDTIQRAREEQMRVAGEYQKKLDAGEPV